MYPALSARISAKPAARGEGDMLPTVLIVVVVLMLLGALPRWPHSREWGYYPSGGLGLVMVILVILLLMGRL